MFGLTSTLAGGILGDRLSKKNWMANAQMIIFGNLMATPLIALCVFSPNFWFSMACTSLSILVSGTYLAPAITMMQNATSKKKTGIVVSVYSFYGVIGQALSPFLFGICENKFRAALFPRVYGYLILGFVALGYLGSAIFYYKGGRAYEKVM